MRKRSLYLRLAATNIRKNGRFYIPFLLTAAISVALFFNLCSIGLSQTLPGGGSMAFLMLLGIVIVAIFSAVFLYYTNSFLIKRRKKELALYNILGMEKRHIARVMGNETLLSALMSIGGGLALGVVLDRLLFLVLLNLMHFDVTLRYELQPFVLALTAAVFALIFFFLLLANLRQLRRAKPAELLSGGNVGEREPKSRWLLTAAGVVTLGAGYWLSITTENALAALGLFFLAVLLVIIGTFCLFIAGSIAILKALKRNKSYYYRAKHFVSVSGMLYRMKQNAAGLASICILSTMVMVTVATTVSLYAAMDDITTTRYPTDITLSCNAEGGEAELVRDSAQRLAGERGLTVDLRLDYECLSLSFGQVGGELSAEWMGSVAAALTYVELMTTESYTSITGESVPPLCDGEVAVYTQSGSLPDTFTMLGRELTVGQRLAVSPVLGSLSTYVANVYVIVLPDAASLLAVRDAARLAYDQEDRPADSIRIEHTLRFDVSGSDEEEISFYNDLLDEVLPRLSYVSCDDRAMGVAEFYELYGGFLFLGIFLGLLFLMAAVLIIYYKQLIEGYDDRARYVIMREVGMDKKLTQSSIHSQILTLFTLPIGGAVVHLAFAFPMLSRLLAVLNMYNVGLFAVCTLCTAATFALVYLLVYAATAKTYYRIVSERA